MTHDLHPAAWVGRGLNCDLRLLSVKIISVTDLLSTNPFVGVLALDFSKAFDTVRKMALLNVPDPVYNWLVDFFSDHKHCTSFGDSVSAYQPISASIIQGSAIGPVSFVVNASDLSTVTPGNRMHKYADDTYIVIPACNNRTREVELDHVALWAQENNLKLNRANNLY